MIPIGLNPINHLEGNIQGERLKIATDNAKPRQIRQALLPFGQSNGSTTEGIYMKVQDRYAIL